MSRKLVLLILISSLLVILPVSTSSSQFISSDGSLDNCNVEVGNSAAYVSVPFHFQSNNYYCGPAALGMVFDYYGEDIPQTEIADAARTYPYVTYPDELRRAAHFSNLSTSLGDEMLGNITGYSARKVGYAAFEQRGLTIDDLKTLINKGEPLIVLMWWTPSKGYGHYRVVVGYNETHIIMHDPWNKDIWGGTYGGANTSMTYSTFLDLWEYSGNWGLWIHPWDIELQMPSTVSKGDDFEVTANITYPCSTPFDIADYPASSCKATIELQEGLELVLGETTQHLGNIIAGNSVETSWSIHASETGFCTISVTVTGTVEGNVGAHGTYPSYSYGDRIGGSCIYSLSIINETYRVHNIDTGLNYTSIQEAINASETFDGHTISVEAGTYYENVVVNKTVILVGEDRENTTVNGGRIGTVVNIAADNVAISDLTILNSSEENGFSGVEIYYRKNVTVVDCNLRNNNVGIRIAYSKDVKAKENMVSHSYGGIVVNYSKNCTIVENHVSDNSWGISLYGSRNCKLQNNAMVDNLYNLCVNGETPADFANYIDSSNTVNGKLVYYWINQSNLEINPSTYPNLGYLALINSTEIVIRDLSNVTKNFSGFLLVNTNNSKISNVCATGNYAGACVYLSYNITVEKSIILGNTASGIYLGYSENSTIVLNTVASHTLHEWANGIELYHSKYNTVTANNILNNKYGVSLYHSDENSVYRNNFVENTYKAETHTSYNNIWDDCVEGNYWSDYSGVDSNRDGIGDTPLVIDGHNRDKYPLMGIFSSFNTSLSYHVNVISNSTIEDFEYFESNSTIKMHVYGEPTLGFCRVCIPHNLIQPSYLVKVDGHPPLYFNGTIYDNGTHRWIYFAYQHPMHEVVIAQAPQKEPFPTGAIAAIVLIAGVGTILLVYFIKIRKTTEKVK